MNTFETLTLLRSQRSAVKSVVTSVTLPKPAANISLRPSSTLRQTFVVTHIQGMHARPCALIIKALQPFDCTVTVQTGSFVADGRSILGLLSLAAGCHSKLNFTVTGPDAPAAMAAIARLFEKKFEQAYVCRA